MECKINGASYPIYEASFNPEQLLQKFASEAPNSVKKFNEKQFKLEDTSQLISDVNKEQWLSDLKLLSSWQGPYKPRENAFLFVTATEAGNFEGYMLLIDLTSKEIALEFLSKNSGSCGLKQSVDNN